MIDSIAAAAYCPYGRLLAVSHPKTPSIYRSRSGLSRCLSNELDELTGVLEGDSGDAVGTAAGSGLRAGIGEQSGQTALLR